MKRLSGIIIFAVAAAVAAGCATGPAPIKEGLECAPQEQVVCTGKSATKLEGNSDDMQFCRCQRLDTIH